jgi:hypothetical protein
MRAATIAGLARNLSKIAKNEVSIRNPYLEWSGIF